MIEFFASRLKTLSKRSILILSGKDFYRWTLSLKFWINSGHFNGLPSNRIKSMCGECLVSNSCCKAAATVMFSLVTALSTVSSPSVNKSMKLWIGWEWGLLELHEVFLLFSPKLSCMRSLETVFKLVGIYEMFSVLSFKSTSSELGMGEKPFRYDERVKSTLIVMRCTSSFPKYVSIFSDWLSIFWISVSNSKLLYALYS